MNIFLKSNLLRWLGHEQAGEITLVGIVPTALAGVAVAQAQQKAFQAVARPALLFHGRSAGADQVAHGFILLVGYVDAGQFPGPIKARQLIGIAPVGLDAIGSLLGDQRRGNHLTVNALAAQVPANDEAARTSFVDQTQLHVVLGELFAQFIDGIQGAADDAVAADFSGVLGRDGYRDGFFVDVQANVMHDFVHGCLVSFNCYRCPGYTPGL